MQTTFRKILPLIATAALLQANSVHGGISPILSCANVTVECTGGLTTVDYTASAVDDMGHPLTLDCTPPSGSGFQLGSITVNCTARDSSGNSGSCDFVVTVEDTTRPSIDCSSNITTETGNANGKVVTYIAGASDACGLASFTCDPKSGETFPVGTTTVSCFVSDTTGNKNDCSFNVTVNLIPPPTLTCPTDISMECTGGLTPVTYDVTASDASGNPLAVVCTPPSGTGFRLGVSNVTCTATNDVGGSSDCTFTVTVVDTKPPQVTCNTNIMTETGDAGGKVVTYIAGASDPCGLSSFDCSPRSGSTFLVGTTTVTCTATDTQTNSASCSFEVTVTLRPPPTVTCPVGISMECSGGLTPVTYVATALDASGATLPVTCDPPSGSGFRLGVSNVTCTATDSLGLLGSCTFTVTIVDTTPPSVTCNTNILTETIDSSGKVVTYTAGTSDACGLASFDCSPRSGEKFPVGTTTVTCLATDNAGNPGSCSFEVTVTLIPPPTLTCPSGVSAECTGGLTPVTYVVTAVDASGAPVPVICDPPSGSGFRLGVSNVTCTATDSLGLSSSCTFTVTVVDTTPPNITCNTNITVETTHSGSDAVVTYIAAASDACGLTGLDCSPPSGSAFPVGTTTVVCTTADSAGNSKSCSFQITVLAPNQCPTAVAKASPNAQLFPGQTDTIVIAKDNTNGCVTLDATMSSDADGDPLRFSWLTDLDGDGTKELIGTGATVTKCLQVGTHDICLVVSDGRCSVTNVITVDVLTPCEAEGFLILIVQQSTLSRQTQRPLIASLKASCASFESGGLTSGSGQLHAFQNKVRSHLADTDPVLAQELTDGAQAIIDAVSGP